MVERGGLDQVGEEVVSSHSAVRRVARSGQYWQLRGWQYGRQRVPRWAGRKTVGHRD